MKNKNGGGGVRILVLGVKLEKKILKSINFRVKI